MRVQEERRLAKLAAEFISTHQKNAMELLHRNRYIMHGTLPKYATSGHALKLNAVLLF
uniref:Uncharacterized protein n=1 Tax=Anopheles atroparvus TaxID=41427 RepID=A0AAG5D4S9_ANOAO